MELSVIINIHDFQILIAFDVGTKSDAGNE